MTPYEFDLLLRRYYLAQSYEDRRAAQVAFVIASVNQSKKGPALRRDNFHPHGFHMLVAPRDGQPTPRHPAQTVAQQVAMAEFITLMARQMRPTGVSSNGDSG